MAIAARILVLLMATLAFANAQCLTWCSLQPCRAMPTGHCHQHSGKAAPTACSHGQFARTAEIQAAPEPIAAGVARITFTDSVAARTATDPVQALKFPDLPPLRNLRI
jgi:hypothetical protein